MKRRCEDPLISQTLGFDTYRMGNCIKTDNESKYKIEELTKELERKHAQLADMEKKVEIYEALIVRSSSVQLTQSLQSLTREFERHDVRKVNRKDPSFDSSNTLTLLRSQLELLRHEDSLHRSKSQFVRRKSIRSHETGSDGRDGNVVGIRKHHRSNPLLENKRDGRYYGRYRKKSYHHSREIRKNMIDEVMTTSSSSSDSTISSSQVSVSSVSIHGLSWTEDDFPKDDDFKNEKN